MSKFKVGDEVCLIRKDAGVVAAISTITRVDNDDVCHSTSYRLESNGDEPMYDFELFRKDEVEAELERRYKEALDEFRTWTSKYKVGDKLIYIPKPSWSLLNEFSMDVFVVKVSAVLPSEKGVRHYSITADKFTANVSESDLYTKETAQSYIREQLAKAMRRVDTEAAKWLAKIDEEFGE